MGGFSGAIGLVDPNQGNYAGFRSTANSSQPISYSSPSNDVRFTRPELMAVIEQYDLIRDCITGERAVKERGEKYLPVPNAHDKSEENRLRYVAYKTRAVFYNATGRTQKGMVGQIFARDPVVELPTGVEDSILNDADGTGVSLLQAAKKTAASVLAYGRAGLYTDYPTTDSMISKKQLAEGDVRPVILHYEPWQIRNWRTIIRGSRTLNSLIVLMEPIQVENGQFGLVDTVQYRVLQLGTDELYEVEIWREVNPGGGQFDLYDTYYPQDSTGARLDEIPFSFIGAENNDAEFDDPPMYDLAVVNIAHYRNSGDNEESLFLTGQPTLAVIGLDEEWLKNVLDGVIPFGARAGIPLPTGADIKLITVPPNTVLREAMLDKEKLMVNLGARIAENPSVQKTATQSAFDESSETSILSSSSGNVGDAYTVQLRWAARFTGEDPDTITFNLNKEFDVARMTPDDRKQTIAEWQAEAICFTEMRTRLRRAGVVTMDDDEAKDEIAADQAEILKGLSLESGVANPALAAAGLVAPGAVVVPPLGTPGAPPPAVPPKG